MLFFNAIVEVQYDSTWAHEPCCKKEELTAMFSILQEQ